MFDTTNSEYDILFKVLLLGDSGSGKTSLILRYTNDVFQEVLVSSIGVDFKTKTHIVKDKTIKLQIVSFVVI